MKFEFIIRVFFFFYLADAPKQQPNYHLKNTDKSLFLTSVPARECPLCHKRYKRMVYHFRNAHPSYEVFVSRLSQEMATTLMHSQLPTNKYARYGGMPHLKMICPFCECEKDFFIPYWNNHIRTHTGSNVHFFRF